MPHRYVFEIDLKRTPALSAAIAVIGSGVAGLRAALAAAAQGADVILLAKASLEDSNTSEAQGGVAVALPEGDSVEDHLHDTLDAGAGICRENAARTILSEGPDAVRELISWGAQFDHENGRLAFGREAAHGRARILHAEGDQTGREISRVLLEKARSEPRISLLDNSFAADLMHHEGAVWGVLAISSSRGPVTVSARAVILASGGLGQLFRETTNPQVTTGDGIAMAARAGAVLEDMEFVQFHPTTLYLAGAKRMLISEAVRGEGAFLLNTRRERFMPGYHELAELAPRDVVSRAILDEMHRTESPHVYLDLRHLDPDRIHSRFPYITRTCAAYDLDITSGLIPVRPSAHYFMGGIRTDLEGRTSVSRLYACGECACTGLHGANRLASNSLLEGLVMGRRVGVAAASEPDPGTFPLRSLPAAKTPEEIPLDLRDMALSIKALMWRQVGIVREGEGLASAERSLSHWRRNAFRRRFTERPGIELQNMLLTASLVARSAATRTESRGAHFRRDYPAPSDEWLRHIPLSIDDLDAQNPKVPPTAD